MIAERYKKNTEEDKLTGHFFGTLRYSGFEKILQPIFVKCIRPTEFSDKIKMIRGGYWADKIYFWLYDSPAEIDVLLDFDEILIGVEVKYQSGLSGDNQLEREAEILNQKANGREKILILLAPEKKCREIVKKTRRRNIFNEFGVNLCSISWEDVSDELTKLQLKDYDALIAKDLIDLLKLKGFESFRSFDISVELDDFSKDFFTSDEEVTNLTGEDYDKIIKKVFEIAAKTHDNIGKLIKSCKGMCEKAGYKLLTKDFISWWTTRDDDDSTLPASASWSTRWFILLFKRKDDEKNSVYMLEINLTIPNVTAAKFIYKHEVNYINVNKDFDSYSLPVNMDDRYSYKDVEVNGFTFKRATLQAYRNKNWANSVLFVEFPLSEINAGNIQEKIFGTFDKLAELKS